MKFLVWLHPWIKIIKLHPMRLTEYLMEMQYIVLRGETLYLWWIWTVKRSDQPHTSCDCSHQIPLHSIRSSLLKSSMDLVWIIFYAIKILGSYIILVGIFINSWYKLLVLLLTSIFPSTAWSSYFNWSCCSYHLYSIF